MIYVFLIALIGAAFGVSEVYAAYIVATMKFRVWVKLLLSILPMAILMFSFYMLREVYPLFDEINTHGLNLIASGLLMVIFNLVVVMSLYNRFLKEHLGGMWDD